MWGLRINIQRNQQPGLTSLPGLTPRLIMIQILNLRAKGQTGASDLNAKMFHQLAEHFSIMGGLVLFAVYKFAQFFFAAGEREHIGHFKIILFIGGVFVGMFGKRQFAVFKTEEVADLHHLVAGKTVL